MCFIDKLLGLQIINEFGSLVQKESDQKGSNIKIFTSYFMHKLLDVGGTKSFTYKNVERFTKKEELFAFEKVAIPVNVENFHWIMLTADMLECRILVHDSLSICGHEAYSAAFLRYLKEEAVAKTGCSLDELSGGKQWHLGNARCPQQGNAYDCGVFTCIFMECFALNIPVYVNAGNARQCREKIGVDILRQQLSY